MQDLREAVAEIAARVARHRGPRRIGEQNTKAAFIEPLIAALGWDVKDFDEVRREYRRRPADSPVDYALLVMGSARLFIEAKGWGENLDDQKWAKQTLGYATVAGVEWVALTDGVEWRIYNSHAPVPIEEKLFRRVGILDDREFAVETLSLLSKDNMRDHQIEVLWSQQFIDNRLRESLERLFSSEHEPDASFLRLLRKTTGLTPSELRAGLTRLRISLEALPAAALPERTTQKKPEPAQRSSAQSRSRARDRQRVPKPRTKYSIPAEEAAVGIQDLIAAGLLVPPVELRKTYMGEDLTALLRIDGSIELAGTIYTSLSTSGEAARRKVKGPSGETMKLNTDGWRFWRVLHDSKWVPIGDLRRELNASRSDT
jgi:predicted type IV restriction endonuclease